MKRGKRENKKEQKEKKKRAIAPNNSWRYISVRERSRRCTFSQGEQNKTKKEITEVIGNQRLIWLHQRQFDVMMGGMGSFRKKSPAKERKKKRKFGSRADTTGDALPHVSIKLCISIWCCPVQTLPREQTKTVYHHKYRDRKKKGEKRIPVHGQNKENNFLFSDTSFKTKQKERLGERDKRAEKWDSWSRHSLGFFSTGTTIIIIPKT